VSQAVLGHQRIDTMSRYAPVTSALGGRPQPSLPHAPPQHLAVSSKSDLKESGKISGSFQDAFACGNA
jgi:hypothetical protein